MTLEVLTHTKRRNWQNCPRYYMHSHLDHLTPRIFKAGRRRGTIFGQGIEFCLKHKDDPGYDLAMFSKVFVNTRYEQAIEGENIDSYEVAAMEVEAAKVGVMVEQYVLRYGYDTRREIQFDLPLTNPSTGKESTAFKLGGKIDGIARTEKSEDKKLVTLIEDKFVASIQRAMILRLPLDSQVSEYVDAFLSMGWDTNVAYRHTRYSSMKLAGPKEYKTKDNYPGETIDELCDRLRTKIAENPESYFDEQTLHFPQAHLDDYRNGRWGIAAQIFAAQQSHKLFATEPGIVGPELAEAFPMNSSRCWEYGGCEFIPICTKQEDARALYVVKSENPELEDDEGSVTSVYGTEQGTDASNTGE